MSKLLQSFKYAFAGLRLAWVEEANFRIQSACAVFVIVLGIVVNLSMFDFVLIVLVTSCVLTAEVFNTALEELCDKFQPTHDPHVAKIKDLSAAAVLLMSAGAIIIGALIFLPYL